MVKKQIKIVSERTLFIWFVLAGLILLFAPSNMTSKLQFAFARIFCRPLTMGRSVTLSAQAGQLTNDYVSRKKYNQLQNHLANVTQGLQQERQKVEKLSGLRSRTVWKGVNFVLADVIALPDNSSDELIINRGKNDNLTKGQFVLGDYSLIGAVSGVDSRIARVRLVTNPASKIAVMIGQLDVGSIMQGDGNNSAKVRLLPTKYKVRAGDVVYARKKPGFLDTPMVVGVVTRCERDAANPLLWDITVRPACDLTRLNMVDVIVMNPDRAG